MVELGSGRHVCCSHDRSRSVGVLRVAHPAARRPLARLRSAPRMSFARCPFWLFCFTNRRFLVYLVVVSHPPGKPIDFSPKRPPILAGLRRLAVPPAPRRRFGRGGLGAAAALRGPRGADFQRKRRATWTRHSLITLRLSKGHPKKKGINVNESNPSL